MVTQNQFFRKACFGIAFCCIGFSFLNSIHAEENLAQYYGFEPLEIFKLNRRSSNLLSADFNQDGINDLALFDNSHSRIDLLLRKKGKPETKPASSDTSVNDISDTGNFKHVKIPVSRKISTIVTGDFNSDGLPDLAYFGLPDRLVILFQEKNNTWNKKKKTIRLADVAEARWIMVAGDLNGDKKDDIAVLGKKVLYTILQNKEGKIETPKIIYNTSEKLRLLQLADLNGDGKKDICYQANAKEDRNFCVRFQMKNGESGPEVRFNLSKPRSITIKNLDNLPGDEIISIDSLTGRVRISKLIPPVNQEGQLSHYIEMYGFGPRGTGRGCDLVTGDVNGDGRPDVLISDPDAAQLTLFLQKSEGGLSSGQTFPGLVGTSQIRLKDLDKDGKPEIIVLSNKEKVIGVCKYENNRITFPQLIPINGTPHVFEFLDLDQDGKPELICILKHSKKGSSSKTYHLAGYSYTNEKTWKPFAWKEKKENTLSLPSTPAKLIPFTTEDKKQTGFLVFYQSTQEPGIILFNGNENPSFVKTKGGIQLGSVKNGAVTVLSDATGEFLVSQKSFARRITLKTTKEGEKQWIVKDQYNATGGNAKIEGALSINFDGKEGNEIVLIDSGTNRLQILKKEDNLFRLWKEIELGNFEYKNSYVADLNGDKVDDILFFGRRRFGVVYSGNTEPKTSLIASFETKKKKIYFSDTIAGDINNDGFTDLVLIDTHSQNLVLLDFDRVKTLQKALSFRIFEQKGFAQAEEIGVEPREGMIKDVTGDNLPDLILLIHDRILIYPQSASGK